MSVTNFLPNVWSAKLQESLKAALVYGNCVNTDHAGEVSDMGQTVKINELSPITVAPYNKAVGLGDPQELDSTLSELVLDQAQSFNFIVHDADAVQANVDLMTAAMRDAAYRLSVPMDTYVASIAKDAAITNTIGTDLAPIVPTKDTAYDYIVDLGVKLDEANVPNFNRFIVVPSWFQGLMLKDPRFVTNDPALRATGAIAEVNGMFIYKSNNVPNTNGELYKIMAGYKGAISFVNQITKIEAIRSAKFFGDEVRGLAVYGAKLVQPSGVAVLTASKE